MIMNSSQELQQSSELSYINALPFELLDKIFKKCGHAITLGNPNPFPFNLGQVCRRWRSVIYSSSTYWSCFIIDNDKSPNVVRQQLLVCLSKAEMLSFSINTSYFSPSMKEVMEVIKHEVHRWKNVSIPTYFLSDIADPDLSNQEKLRISGGRFPHGLHAPNLTHLCLHSMPSDSFKLVSSTLQEQLTHLHLNHCSFRSVDLFRIMEGLKNVEELQLSWVYIYGSPINDHEGRIRMERLRSLMLAMSTDSNSFVLDSVHAPNLLSLRLYAINRDAYDDGTSARGFIQESNCHLREITLWKYPISSFLLITDRLLSVRSLYWGCTSTQVDGIRQFVERLPRLNSLTLWYDAGYDDDLFGGLLPFLRSNEGILSGELMFGGTVECEEGDELGSGRSQVKIVDRMADTDKFFMDYIMYDDLKPNRGAFDLNVRNF